MKTNASNQNQMFEGFNNLYSLQKTLRFELKPVGKTIETLKEWLKELEDNEKNKTEKSEENKNILLKDLTRAEDYNVVKKIIDEYHKDFIEEILKESNWNEEEKDKIKNYINEYNSNKSPKSEKENPLTKLRDIISSKFSNDKRFKSLFGDELFGKKKSKGLLESFIEREDIKQKISHLFSPTDGNEEFNLDAIKEKINHFKQFTVYFIAFNENRKNLYSNEEKFSTIAHRIVHENLPKFLDNIKIYNTIKDYLNFDEIEKELNLQQKDFDEIFSIDNYYKRFTQKGIDEYNELIGGRTEQGKKIKGLNEFINLHNQQQNQKLPHFKSLYKLPLFERTSSSFRYQPIENDKELIEQIKEYNATLHSYCDENDSTPIKVLEELKNLLKQIHTYREGIYINGGITLTGISQKIFGSWNYIHNALSEYYDTHMNPVKRDKKGNPKKRTDKEEKAKEKWLKQKQFPITLVEHALWLLKEKESNEDVKKKITQTTLCDFLKQCGKDDQGKDIFERIEQKLTEKNEKNESLKDLFEYSYKEADKKLMQDKNKTLLIKNFLDAILGDKEHITEGLLHFIKAMIPRERVADKNEVFYSALEKYYSVISEIIPLYNKVRNYLTQKPYSVEKIKLNFDNPTLLNGWDENKEADNTCVLLRKNGFYYLGIMNKDYRKVFENCHNANNGEDAYEKMIYKLLPGANKMLPKVFFAESNEHYFNPSEEILRIRNTASYSKNGQPQDGYAKAEFNIDDCRKLIDFYKDSIQKHDDWKKFNFNFKSTNEYVSIDEFYREVEQQGYKISFKNIPSAYIDQLVSDGKLYLFQIYNKDFSENKKSKGKDNLHTMYWKALFDEDNLKNIIFKLNGEAEVFFRPKSINNYNDDIWQKGHHYDDLKEKFQYPIIKDKRFAEDKFFFHVPITINFKAEGKENINDKVNDLIKNDTGNNIHIIGIDRGERHLLYVSVINQDGEVVEQCSLNTIISERNGIPFKKDYHELLDKREGQRDKARKDWQTIENIKELKEGYLSHVVHKITQLILKYNAIVVMEDLNAGFKRGRQKVEKQVYQKFEKMLIEKLNYLVLKDKDKNQAAGVLKGLQLTNKFESFQKMGKQSGIIFYVPAAYTSAIDPITGYVQYLFPLKQADSIEKAQTFYKNFNKIRYNQQNNWFEFEVDYKKFGIKYFGKPEWTICTTNTERYVWNPKLNNNKGGQECINVTEKLKELFNQHHISFNDRQDIKEQIAQIQDKSFFTQLNYLLNATLKLRHNNGKHGEEEQDYILSPVEPFFDSRKAEKNLPQNADANGAYNIARKGLVLINRLKKMGAEEFEKTKKSKDGKAQWLPHEEWVTFAQKEKQKTILQES